MQDAPLYSDLADGPEGGSAYWLTASDGVRLRIGVWDKGEHGTVFMFPGRTEYVEKYGRAAEDLRQRGFASLAVDWRGQGIADRILEKPLVGHIDKFSNFQNDVAEVVKAAEALKLPKPYFLLAHSMGGCIGLRSLTENLPVAAAAFSAPMWNINLPPVKRPLAHTAWFTSKVFGLSHVYAPDTTGDNIYVLTENFEDNELTHNREMWGFMRSHAEARPELHIGGPSMNWVGEALKECQALAALPAPDVPAITFLGDKESIVCKAAIERQMARWPDGQLVNLDDCRHEPLMESPELQADVFNRIAAFFRANASRQNTA